MNNKEVKWIKANLVFLKSCCFQQLHKENPESAGHGHGVKQGNGVHEDTDGGATEGEHVPSGTRKDRFGQWGEGTPLTSAACLQRAPVASESSSRRFFVEGQGKGTGPGKLRAAPRKPWATRHPGLGQNTCSDSNMGGRVRELHTPHGTRHPDSSIRLPQNHRCQGGRRSRRLRRPSLSCSPGHEASTPARRLPGHLMARRAHNGQSRPPPSSW